MSGLSVCFSRKCLLKKKCYRFIYEKDLKWQNHAIFNGGKNCDGFLDNGETIKKPQKQRVVEKERNRD